MAVVKEEVGMEEVETVGMVVAMEMVAVGGVALEVEVKVGR